MVLFSDKALRSDRRLRIAQALVMAVGVVSHLALMAQVFHPAVLTTMSLVFPVWVALPWGMLLICSRLARGRSVASWWVLGLAGVYLALGGWSYWDTLYIHSDPQGGLVFLFVPLLGALAALVLMAGLWLSRPRPHVPR